MANEDILAQAATATTQMMPKQPTTLGSFGPAPMQMPPPLPHYQAPQLQFGQAGNEFQTVEGRKRADKEALFHGVASIIKSGTDYINQKKDRILAMDLHSLMDAQQGYIEAQQALQANPNDPVAQQALERNASIMNTIATDPKKSKQLQKAMNVDLFGGGKNKRENQIFQQAWKEYQQKQQAGNKGALSPQAQRFMQSQPMRLGVTPEMAIREQLIKSGVLPKADEILKASQENYKTLMTAKSAEERTAALRQRTYIIARNGQLIAGAKDKQTAAYLRAAELRHMTEEDRFKTEISVANIHAGETDKRLDAIRDIASDKNITAQEKNQITALSTRLKTLQDYRKNLVTESSKLQTELDKRGSGFWGHMFSNMNDQDAQAARIKVSVNTKLLQTLDEQIQEINGRVDMIRNIRQNLSPTEPGASNIGGATPDEATPFTPDNEQPPDNTDTTEETPQ